MCINAIMHMQGSTLHSYLFLLMYSCIYKAGLHMCVNAVMHMQYLTLHAYLCSHAYVRLDSACILMQSWICKA